MKKQILMVSIFALSALYGQSSLSELKFGPKEEVISAGKDIDDIVAIVGYDIITRKEMSVFPSKNRQAVLNNLIMKKLLLQAARKYNITVSDTAVNIADQNGLLKQGTDRKNLRDELIIAKLQQQVVNHLVKISDLEVTDSVNKKLKNLTDQIRLVDVLIQPPKQADRETLIKMQEVTREVIEKLNSQSGESVAQRYEGVDYNDLGWIELSQIPPSFAKALVDLPLNQYAKPVFDSDGAHILKIIDRKQQNKNNDYAQQVRISHILIKDKGDAKAKSIIDKINLNLE